jgi:hypothetical protein
MPNATLALEYQVHQRLNLEKVDQEINQAWSSALQDPKFLDQLKKQGIDAAILPQTGTEVIKVEKQGEGITPDEIRLLVSIGTSLAPVVAKIIKDLWVHVILPRIRVDQGEDSIGKEKKKDDSEE